MKAYIVDDNFINRDTLRLLLARYFPEVVVVGESGDFMSAVLEIQHAEVDVLFLDIQLNNGKTGFHVLDALEAYQGAIVFITAHEQYALEAFRYNAVHYLLKPIDPLELGTAISRIMRGGPSVNRPVKSRQASGTLTISNNKSVGLIDVDDILYVCAEGSYARIVKNNTQDITLSKNLKHVSQQLAAFTQFIRVHKSFLINKDYVVTFKRPNTIEMTNKKQIPISLTYRAVIDTLFEKGI